MNASLSLEPVGALTALSAQECDAFLAEIPTETTTGERRLLFNLFERSWDGQGDVVEIGPFLGGTTRAIAWGMSRNPRLAATVLLHTFDRFESYYSAEELRRTIEPMVQRGTFTAEQADALCQSSKFEQLFYAIHQPHDYAQLVRLYNSPMPDRPEEIERSQALSLLDDKGDFGAIFIDGCKSWASTQYAMKYLLPRTRTGAPVIFQDFGWYTCFWISSFTYAMRDFLELESHVDATYVFRLRKTVKAADVTTRFGRRPEDMGESFFRKAAAELMETSRQRGDLHGELISQLHHVAALVTLERRGTAATILQQLDVRRYAAHADMIRGCLKSPTYRPGGEQIFWK